MNSQRNLVRYWVPAIALSFCLLVASGCKEKNSTANSPQPATNGIEAASAAASPGAEASPASGALVAPAQPVQPGGSSRPPAHLLKGIQPPPAPLPK